MDVESDASTVVSVVEGIVDVRNLKQPGKTVQLTGGQSLRVLSTEPLALVPNHVDGLRNIMREVVDQAVRIARTGIPTSGGPAAPTTTPTGGTPTGTATGTSSGSGSGSGTGTPPTTGRPGSGGTGNGDKDRKSVV